MAITGISEFSFGYAFLYEQTRRNWGGLRAAPILPSLQQEADEGWDAHLPTHGTDYYYQFKLSDYLSRRNATYIKDSTYTAAYFRIAFHRRDGNRQHRRLKAHAATHPFTYYVAPEFTGLTEFNSSFISERITENSRIIPIADCDDVYDGDQHYITYQTGNSTLRQHSESKAHETSFTGKEIERVYRSSTNHWEQVNTEFAEKVLEENVEIIRRNMEEEYRRDTSVRRLLDAPPEERTRTGYLRRTASLISIFYGLTLVIVGNRQ